MSFMKRMYKRYAVARTCAALSQLSDRQLADIGVTRLDIHKHVSGLYA